MPGDRRVHDRVEALLDRTIRPWQRQQVSAQAAGEPVQHVTTWGEHVATTRFQGFVNPADFLRCANGLAADPSFESMDFLVADFIDITGHAIDMASVRDDLAAQALGARRSADEHALPDRGGDRRPEHRGLYREDAGPVRRRRTGDLHVQDARASHSVDGRPGAGAHLSRDSLLINADASAL